MTDLDRDFVGYGANPPHPRWPGGARIAVNFVLNYEEGSEPSVQDGETYCETGLTEARNRNQSTPIRFRGVFIEEMKRKTKSTGKNPWIASPEPVRSARKEPSAPKPTATSAA